MEQETLESWRIEQRIYNIIRAVVYRWNWILLAAVVTGIAGDLYLTVTNVPVYRTEASFVLDMPSYGTDGNEEGQISEALGYILKSNVFLDKVKESLGVEKLTGSYVTSSVAGTNIVNIAAEAESPALSYRMMYEMMNQYQDLTSKVIGNMKIDVLQRAQVPLAPVNPVDHKRNLLVFGAAGGGILILLTVLLAYFRNTIKDRACVKEVLQIHLLADIPREPKLIVQRRKIRKKRALLVTQITTSASFVETYRRLAERFERECEKPEQKKVIVVNSAMENEGKTSVAVNLAITLAQKGKKVLVIDGDLAKPAVGKILEMSSAKGLDSLLRAKDDEAADPEILTKYNVDFITAEKPSLENRELLENPMLDQLVNRYRENYDYIFIDTPPAGLLADASIIAGYADAVLMVIRQDYTPVPLISRSIDQYLQQGTHVIGGVVNRSKPVGEKKKKMYGTGGRDGRERI